MKTAGRNDCRVLSVLQFMRFELKLHYSPMFAGATRQALLPHHLPPQPRALMGALLLKETCSVSQQGIASINRSERHSLYELSQFVRSRDMAQDRDSHGRAIPGLPATTSMWAYGAASGARASHRAQREVKPPVPCRPGGSELGRRTSCPPSLQL